MIAQSPSRFRSAGLPALTLGLLILLYAFGGLSASPHPGAQDYFHRVGAEVDRVPYRIDRWIGVDLPYTEVEVRMLRPNKLFSRTYQDPLSLERVSLSIVHCTDVRDMSGHYPPVCYPAHGWKLESSTPVEVVIAGRPQEARAYLLSRVNKGTSEAVRVLSFFVAPGSTGVMWDMAALDRAAKRSTVAGLGAAQVQILTPATQSAATTNEMVSKVLQAIEPVIVSIKEGVE